MKRTPLDVRHQEFTNALSGYSKKDVREFLMSVAEDFEEYERGMRNNQERIAQLEAQVNELRQGEETLKRAVVSAERISNEMKLNAEREASLRIKNAEHQAQIKLGIFVSKWNACVHSVRCLLRNLRQCYKVIWKILTEAKTTAHKPVMPTAHKPVTPTAHDYASRTPRIRSGKCRQSLGEILKSGCSSCKAKYALAVSSR